MVAAVAAITWQVARSEIGSSGLLENFIGLTFLLAVLAHAVFHPVTVSRWAAVCLLWVTYGRWFGDTADLLNASDAFLTAMALAGGGGLAAVLVQIDPVADLFVKWSSARPARSHGHWLMARSLQDAGFLTLCVLIVLALILVPELSDDPVMGGLLALPALIPFGLAVILCGTGLLLSFKTVKARAFFAATGLALFAVLLPVLSGNVLVQAAVSLAALVALCALGTWYNNRFWMLCAYLGLTAVSLWLLQVTIGSLLGQSLFFLVAGVLLLAVALWLARLFRKGPGDPGVPAEGQEMQS
ncbi:hypothetical protein [Roseibium salinum]|uniref:DUF4401 domain-containing protein n=1 Tax=Roseibium salinum TaxID=1604349 RepID=A0ABT3R2V1_9HYPH|nr:hypothetical protein [Roseibium sp. DSM 29163]MCX2723538.1 hypothetical protein [Roseibium sp. DSM 29163]